MVGAYKKPKYKLKPKLNLKLRLCFSGKKLNPRFFAHNGSEYGVTQFCACL